MIRVFYKLLAIFSLSMGYLYDSDQLLSANSVSGFWGEFMEYLASFVLVLSMSIYAYSYLKNHRDYISINSHMIDWYDDANKGSKSLSISDIESFEVTNHEYKSLEYPGKIIFKTKEKTYELDLEEMSLLQFSQVIVRELELVIGKKVRPMIECAPMDRHVMNGA